MKRFISLCLFASLFVSSVGNAATNMVTSTASSGPGSLNDAIAALNNGDTINFNIPGAGPHYLEPPVGGFPLITAHNVTIDGYSQPGAVPNTNPILSNNNAQIKIVLSATNSVFHELYQGMDYNSGTNSGVGFTPGNEFAILGIYGATNVEIKGMCFLGKPGDPASHYGIGLAQDVTHPCTGMHLSGCWIGVDPSGKPSRVVQIPLGTGPFFTNLWDFEDCVAAFSHKNEVSYRFRGTNADLTCRLDVTLNNRNPNLWESDRELITIFQATNACYLSGTLTNYTITVGTSATRYVHTNHIIGVKPGSANARAEFNVLVGSIIPLALEGQRYRVSGNFIGVLPDGMHDYIVPFAEPARFMEGTIEIGRGASDCVVGTDGDGVNDADERNIFGGVPTGGDADSKNLGGYQHVVEFYSASGALGSDRTRNRIAGNYFGVAVDGVTRFTNGVPFCNGSTTGASQYWVGSDYDGVSDDVEANVIFNNYPPGLFYNTAYTNSPRSGNASHGFFDGVGNSALVSFRGNVAVNNYPFPVNPGQGTATNHLATNYGSFVTNYMTKAIVTPFTNMFFPLVDLSSTTARIKGTVPIGKLPYQYTILDFYRTDPEGLTNGLVVPEVLLTNGWVQGRKYLGSYTIATTNVNTWPNLTSAPGQFDLATCNLFLTSGSQITVTANYSQDPPGTHNARVLTSLFSPPVTVGPGACITVNTINNPPGPGETSLATAMSTLTNGATIVFNIPGAGPHYLEPPVGGFPLITAHNVTIDGYSQPGAVPNTNPILSNNNAQIKIVLSATNSVFHELYQGMDYNSGTNSGVGFTPGNEFAILGIYGATNVEIKGMCFLGKPGDPASHYGIGLAQDVTHPCTGMHLSGCWIGVDPSGKPSRVVQIPLGTGPFFTNLWDFEDCVAAFSHKNEVSYRFRGTNADLTCRLDVTLNNRNPNLWESDRELITIFQATNACYLSGTLTNYTITVGTSATRYVHTNHIIGVKPGSANARAEFNVLVGSIIPLALEGQRYRVSGNFIGVLPDGMHDYIVPFAEPARFMEGTIEIGRGASDCVVGTDGDGVNDADERNIFGGVPTGGDADSKNLGGYQHVVEFYSASGALGSDRTRNRIAGNYFGVAVDGVTRFTNGVPFCNGSTTGASQYWVGSDYDGVSDDVEANVIFNNYPPGLFYNTAYTNSPRSGNASHGFFDGVGNSALVSFRGNVAVNNYPFPVNPGQGTATNHLATNYGSFVTNYMTKAIVTPFTNMFFPLVDLSSTTARIKGTVPIGKLPYQYTILDFYRTDPEGLTNGLVVPEVLLTNGWVQGRKYLGSYTIANTNVSLTPNLSPNAGQFELNTCDLGLTNGSQITVTANYSQDLPGTHNARVLTSLFSPPITLGAGIRITSIATNGNNVVISWCGGVAPYTLQKRSPITGGWTDVQTGIAGNSATNAIAIDPTFYQVIGKSN